jgi:hypothetical protein
VHARSILGGIGVERGAAGLQEEDKVAGLCVVCWIFPVYIDPIKAPVFHKSDGSARELSTTSIRAGCSRKVCGVGPASNTKNHFQVAIVLLKDIKLLDTSIGVVSYVIPRICRIMLLEVCI